MTEVGVADADLEAELDWLAAEVAGAGDMWGAVCGGLIDYLEAVRPALTERQGVALLCATVLGLTRALELDDDHAGRMIRALALASPWDEDEGVEGDEAGADGAGAGDEGVPG